MYYTYVLKSIKDSMYYVGYTTDVLKRCLEHEKGFVTSTKHRRPLTLIYYEACLNEYDAKWREKYFKSGVGKRYLASRLKIYFSSMD